MKQAKQSVVSCRATTQFAVHWHETKYHALPGLPPVVERFMLEAASEQRFVSSLPKRCRQVLHT
eukprot:364362-Chlamydomonas_euryale.AAC.16